MKLTKTPSKYRKHDYSLVLTKDELILLGLGEVPNFSMLQSHMDLREKMFSLLHGEAKRLGEQQGE